MNEHCRRNQAVFDRHRLALPAQVGQQLCPPQPASGIPRHTGNSGDTLPEPAIQLLPAFPCGQPIYAKPNLAKNNGGQPQNLDEIENQHVLTEDPSFYVQNASVTDPSLAPAGHSTLYVLLPVSHQHPNIDWNKERDRYRQVALRQMAKLGIHDIERRIRFERVVTPVDWENKFGIYKGATFNLAHNLGQMLHLRPQNRFEEFKRMYLVGGGTHPGSGLPVIFESARITSKLLLEDFGRNGG